MYDVFDAILTNNYKKKKSCLMSENQWLDWKVLCLKTEWALCHSKETTLKMS